MTPDAFLETIRQNPDDDGPRLVYADWLEERGDPLGEFIRVQCELARAQRNNDLPELDALQVREEQLLTAHGIAWLGALGEFVKSRSLTPFFRRGFVEQMNVDSNVFVGEHELIGREFPMLASAVLYGVLEFVEGIALCPVLGQLKELGIADWIYYGEAQSIANSRHLVNLKSLWLWIREYGQAREVGFALTDAPGLEEIRLVHLYDFTHDDQQSDDETRWRRRVEDELNEQMLADRGAIFQVASSSDCCFNVRTDLNRGIIAGKMADRQGLAGISRDDQLHVVVFDCEGKQVGHERRNLRGLLPRYISENERDKRNAMILPFIRNEFGLERGTARVREFVDPCGLAVHQFTSRQWDFIRNPEAVDDARNRLLAGRIHRWIESGHAVLDWEAQHWLNSKGEIQSSIGRSESDDDPLDSLSL